MVSPDLAYPSVYGSELEYGFEGYADKTRWNDRRDIKPDRFCDFYFMRRALQSALPYGVRQVNGMLTNGGRYYEDHFHPEYSTPECDTLEELAACEFAADKLVFESMRHMQEEGELQDFKLNRRVISDNWKTWGYHVNVLRPSLHWQAEERVVVALASHLATSGVWAGAGCVQPELLQPQQRRFYLSQKALGLTSIEHNDTVFSKPIVNTRYEPLAEDGRYYRQHITSLDPTFLPMPTMLKAGTSSLVLRLAQANELPRSVFLADPLTTIKNVAKDVKLQNKYLTHDGDFVTALDVQEAFIEKSLMIADRHGLPGTEKRALQRWIEVHGYLRRYQTDPADSTNNAELFGKVEWFARYQSLVRLMVKRGLDPRMPESWSHESIYSRDKLWGHLDPETGLALRLAYAGKFDAMPDADHIGLRLHQPPDTRAQKRVQLLENALREKPHVTKYPNYADYDSETADWVSVTNGTSRYFMLEPLKPVITSTAAVSANRGSP